MMRNRTDILRNTKYLAVLCILLLLAACGKKNAVEKEIEKIPVTLNIERFDLDFASATPEDLPALKKKYPLFFPTQFPDSVWVGLMSDTLQIELETEVKKMFPDEKKLQKDLVPLFQHIQYYFPKYTTPTLVTVISDVDYKNRVILDSLLLIGLDNYLGSEHRFYEGIDRYIAKGMDDSRIASDVADVYSRDLIAPAKMNHFLDQMLFYGRQLYLQDLWLPNTEDHIKIGYTKDELEWAKENEMEMWRYLIENEMIYSTDPVLANRFIRPAPFSKFYLEIDNDSPGMIGRYLGWTIARAYMENNKTSLEDFLRMDAEQIFVNSKYKPKK